METKNYILIAITIIAIIAFVINYFEKRNRLIRKFKANKSFPKWSEYNKRESMLSINWFVGHRNSPEYVNIYEFDFKNQTSTHYQNTDNGRKEIFSGTLSEGIEKYISKNKTAIS